VARLIIEDWVRRVEGGWVETADWKVGTGYLRLIRGEKEEMLY
jgi:hypothetical protein